MIPESSETGKDGLGALREDGRSTLWRWVLPAISTSIRHLAMRRRFRSLLQGMVHLSGALYVPFCMACARRIIQRGEFGGRLDGRFGTVIFFGLNYSLFAYLAGHARFSQYLRIIPVRAQEN